MDRHGVIHHGSCLGLVEFEPVVGLGNLDFGGQRILSHHRDSCVIVVASPFVAGRAGDVSNVAGRGVRLHSGFDGQLDRRTLCQITHGVRVLGLGPRLITQRSADKCQTAGQAVGHRHAGRVNAAQVLHLDGVGNGAAGVSHRSVGLLGDQQVRLAGARHVHGLVGRLFIVAQRDRGGVLDFAGPFDHSGVGNGCRTLCRDCDLKTERVLFRRGLADLDADLAVGLKGQFSTGQVVGHGHSGVLLGVVGHLDGVLHFIAEFRGFLVGFLADVQVIDGGVGGVLGEVQLQHGRAVGLHLGLRHIAGVLVGKGVAVGILVIIGDADGLAHISGAGLGVGLTH